MPLRLTILHFEQRFLTDADTFILLLLSSHSAALPVDSDKQPKLLFYLSLQNLSSLSKYSQYDRVAFCHSNAMLKMGG
jgi:hypothetical protein